MDWKDIWIRCGKTFVQAFFGVLVPELCAVLNNGWPSDWPTFWAYFSPVLAAACAAGLCAVWNIILQKLEQPEA